MALRKCAQLAVRSIQPSYRGVHVSARNPFFMLKKPLPSDESSAVGYEKIEREAAKAGEDPMGFFNRDDKVMLAGDGSRKNPYIVPSRNTKRLVMIEPPNHEGGPPLSFWVTLEEGGRCPYSGKHYKLHYDPSDKWGIDELDLFKH